jgi:hypothetical protein
VQEGLTLGVIFFAWKIGSPESCQLHFVTVNVAEEQQLRVCNLSLEANATTIDVAQGLRGRTSGALLPVARC